MTADIASLDAHEQPSAYLRRQWKTYAKAAAADIERSGDIDEVGGGTGGAGAGAGAEPPRPVFRKTGALPAARVAAAFAAFLADRSPVDGDVDGGVDGGVDDSVDSDAPADGGAADIPVYSHPLLPGLLVVRRLVPPRVQKRLLDRMVHRDLGDRRHQTNMHLHYDLPYAPAGASFFAYPPPANAHSAADVHAAPGTFTPKDPAVHRPLSIQQVLDKRLHWVTLGGQYDWTNRVYPAGVGGGDAAAGREDPDAPPRFPADLTRLLAGLFPDTAAQAAIVNFYSPGDTMMIHRDVSEETDKGLISLSIGCDALFMAAPTREFAAPGAGDRKTEGEAADGKEPYILLRLRSGDAVYMTDHARFAWHGVPKVIKGTCPDGLADWPAGEHTDGRYEAWRGWMRNKRVNFNVRQMRD